MNAHDDKRPGILGSITEGLTESTRAVHEINRENLDQVRAQARADHKAAATPDPGLAKVKEAHGVGGKLKAVAQNIADGARENSEAERERRAEIRSHAAYAETLKDAREHRQGPGH